MFQIAIDLVYRSIAQQKSLTIKPLVQNSKLLVVQ